MVRRGKPKGIPAHIAQRRGLDLSLSWSHHSRHRAPERPKEHDKTEHMEEDLEICNSLQGDDS